MRDERRILSGIRKVMFGLLWVFFFPLFVSKKMEQDFSVFFQDVFSEFLYSLAEMRRLLGEDLLILFVKTDLFREN